MRFKEGDFVSIKDLDKFLSGDAPREIKDFAEESSINKFIIKKITNGLSNGDHDLKYYLQNLEHKTHESYFMDTELMLAITEWD